MAVNEYEELLKGNPPAQGNEYDSLLSDMSSNQKQKIQANVSITKDVVPAQKSQAIKLSEEMNLPVAFVERNIDTLKGRQKSNSFDYDKIII